jgi:hypothetical protein
VVLPSQEAAAPALKAFEPLKKEVVRAEKAFDENVARGINPSLFDLSEYTGLKSYPAPLQEVINRRAHIAGMVRGISAEQALREAFTGVRPLLGLGGAAVMGGLAAQDQYGASQ